ncbi:hypothetical protein ACQKNS_05930 [Peribacillus sp. NPDC094092]|uniref:hypothetical protein n=1 Tax=Peribacillus sp. NPDC094092 TaxID=3390611 RepID=UPI003CFDCA9F
MSSEVYERSSHVLLNNSSQALSSIRPGILRSGIETLFTFTWTGVLTALKPIIFLHSWGGVTPQPIII